MKTICDSNIPNNDCRDGILCNNFSKTHRQKYFHHCPQYQIPNKKNCEKDLYCNNFTKCHYNTFAHPFRDNADERKSSNLKYCRFGENCKDFTHSHNEKFAHPFRERKCSLFPCKLLHDHNHLLEFTHNEQYKITSDNNFQCNRSHFFCDDVWKKIIGEIMSSCYYIKSSPIYGTNGNKIKQTREFNSLKYASILTKLLMTSKMFQKILNTDLFSIDIWSENTENITYGFQGTYIKCEDCYGQGRGCTCSEACSQCGVYYKQRF